MNERERETWTFFTHMGERENERYEDRVSGWENSQHRGNGVTDGALESDAVTV